MGGTPTHVKQASFKAKKKAEEAETDDDDKEDKESSHKKLKKHKKHKKKHKDREEEEEADDHRFKDKRYAHPKAKNDALTQVPMSYGENGHSRGRAMRQREQALLRRFVAEEGRRV